MNRKSNLNNLVSYFLLACSFLLVGCQQQENDDNFQILVFSSIPENSLEEIKGFAKTGLEANMQVETLLFPPVVERLVIEIVQHSGDMLIMDRELLAAAYDSNELYELQEFSNSENIIELTEFEIEALKTAGEHAEKGDIYLNALRVNKIEEKSSELSELVVIIPKYTENKEIAFLFLEKIVGKLE
jgi:hypothetical protein